MARVELGKKREEAATTPVLDCGLIPELLDSVVDNKPVPKDPVLSDEQQSITLALLVQGTAMKDDILQSQQRGLGWIIPIRLQQLH